MNKNWAICIGINRYYSLKPLQYAMQDARAMKDFFDREVKFDQVFYFSDDSPEIDTPKGALRSEPTFANLKRFFRERFEIPSLSSGDNLWFFFAGHGELHSGHDYLMPIDVDPGNVEETALKISDISAYLRKSGADNTVLLLDACRSEGRRAPVGIGTDEPHGMVTIYSCSPRQSSYEIDELQHGSFTYALLEGLSLSGANSCATVQRIDQYLRHQVPTINQRYQKPAQTPCTAVHPLSKRNLILLPQYARPEDIGALKLEAYRAELFTLDLELARQWWTRVLALPGADLESVAALERIIKKEMSTPHDLPLLVENEITYASMSDLWSKVLAVLAPRGTQMLLSQQGDLLNFDGMTAVIGCRSPALQNMVRERIPNLETSFESVLQQRVRVSIVSPIPSEDSVTDEITA